MSATYPAETNNNVITSWIPLTTGWTSVEGCDKKFSRSPIYKVLRLFPGGTTTASREDTKINYLAFDPGYGIWVRGNSNKCLPNEVTSWKNQTTRTVFEDVVISQTTIQGAALIDRTTFIQEEGLTKMRTVLSLLPLRCPNEWSTVATFVKSGISTEAMCCPSGYVLSNQDAFSTGVAGNCYSRLGPDIEFESAEYPKELQNNGSYIMPSLTSLPKTEHVTVRAEPIVGWNVQPTASSISNPTTSQINSSFVTSFSTSPTASGSELSSGAKAGIGVSAAVGLLIVIAFIAWIVILRRRIRALSAEIKVSNEPKLQSQGADLNGLFNKPELGGSQIHELSHRSLCELDPISAAVELTAGSPKPLTV